MPTFTYKALSATGQACSSSIDAADRKAAMRKIRQLGLKPVEIHIEGSGPKPSKPSKPTSRPAAQPAKQESSAQRQKTQLSNNIHASPKLALPFYRKLLQLHSGGMPIGDALHLMSHRMTEPSMRQTCEAIYRDLTEGRTLAMAMAARPKIFDPTHPHLIEAAEATGNLVPILKNIISNVERAQELRKKVQGAMVYPILLCLFAMGVVAIFLFFLLPNIEQMLTKVGDELNIAARIMIGLSDFALTDGPYILAALAIAAAATLQWRKTELGREKTDAWMLSVPMLGRIAYNSEACRLTNIIGVMLSNGVNTTETLRLSANVIRNRLMLQQFQSARNLINDGAPFSTAMLRTGLLAEIDTDILGIGEGTGNLAASFEELYKTRADELSDQLKLATNLVAGLALAFAFSLVVVITFAVVLSIMDMSSGLLNR